MTRNVALVIQRYGDEVNGGAELYARQVVERLAQTDHSMEFTVLTTCAVDHVTWKNHYKEGEDLVDGIRVLRFPVQGKRDHPTLQRLETLLALPANYAARWRDEVEYIQAQGPYSPALTDYIRSHREQFDIFLFLGFIFYPTAAGLPLVAEKSLLIPFAHDEPITYFRYMRQLFHLPRKILFCSPEEQAMIRRITHNSEIASDIVGLGFDAPDLHRLPDFKADHGIRNPYVVYVGRIEEGKGCKELVEFHQKYNSRHLDNPIDLVLIGKSAMEIPQDESIHYLGFVPDPVKYSAMKEAAALINPSRFESLSMVFMESLQCGTVPVVSAKSDVLKGHCLRGSCGLYYDNYYEYEVAIERLLADPDMKNQMVANGMEYIDQNYSWDAVIPKLLSAMEHVDGSMKS